MGCWRVLVLRVRGRFGEAGEGEVKAYWLILLPKVDFGVSSGSGVVVGFCCGFAMF